jgi:hypothetical protein
VASDGPGRLLQRRDKEGKVGYEARSGERGGCMWGRLPLGEGESGGDGVDSGEDDAAPVLMSGQKARGSQKVGGRSKS